MGVQVARQSKRKSMIETTEFLEPQWLDLSAHRRNQHIVRRCEWWYSLYPILIYSYRNNPGLDISNQVQCHWFKHS